MSFRTWFGSQHPWLTHYYSSRRHDASGLHRHRHPYAHTPLYIHNPKKCKKNLKWLRWLTLICGVSNAQDRLCNLWGAWTTWLTKLNSLTTFYWYKYNVSQKHSRQHTTQETKPDELNTNAKRKYRNALLHKGHLYVLNHPTYFVQFISNWLNIWNKQGWIYISVYFSVENALFISGGCVFPTSNIISRGGLFREHQSGVRPVWL